MSSILVVNASADERTALSSAFEGQGRKVLGAASIEEALHTLAREEVDHAVSVRTLPDGSGELLVQQAAEVSPHTRILLVTNFSKVKTASDLLRFDFKDYIVDVDDLASVVAGARRGPLPSHRALVQCYLKTVEAVVGLVELTNPLTAGNAASSMRLADGVAAEMGLGEEQRQEVALGALLHDIGNFDVQTGVLEKVDALEPAEEHAIRQHTSRGVQLVDHIDFPWRVKPILRHHHERYDGCGYPDGKKGRAIPIGARIVSVVDAYLSMTTGRPHREPMNHDVALGEIQSKVGAQFDPEVVEAFVKFVERRKQFAGDLFRVKVLVLEGKDGRLARLKLQFLREDFKILSATDPASAVELVEKDDVRFVVADVAQQWDHALELLDGLQERIESFRTAVLLFDDGEGSRERRLTALDSGADEVFPVDVGMAELLSRMRRILRRDEPARRGSMDSEDGGLHGDLTEMPLPEILQMLTMGQKTAKIVIEARARQGALFLDGGHLTHAECGDVAGPGAVTLLLEATTGQFHIHHGVRTDERTVNRDAMGVLLDALRELDERGSQPAPPTAG
ncbi:MAG: HD domain-containing phosphohydrolase [Acidobacteriota bacterium]